MRRETAIERARMAGASVLLGSATPSMESFYHAANGDYVLLELEERIDQKPMPKCYTVDLREELRQGNRSILSEKLQELMGQRLKSHQQTMLFLNRRGVCLLPCLRACDEMPALRCVVEPACGRQASVPLLRAFAERAEILSLVCVQVYWRLSGRHPEN